MLADVGPPIVPVWSTTDLDEAFLWFETLEGTGVEGLVVSRSSLGMRRAESGRR
ncbi:ABC-type taurine transport system substrate-binding protein [Streptomyces achromogenes]|uniref:ABC-type taurine transport system substrate-binding protein n=1 Tax=Streptomyces achromogenes TaxID=67255 RepID=A0ABU0QE04_STRAH|nr:hypothetical protein [Streptomyces achromogenes]MDQ0688900.1 ABC-type taurine transport system substrate-binding protein [Streptomyces achromogenes]MDQ0836069.1 ABC-type taurine transport system substrate-binding protein [Streptomyces achromogenes]